jgi:hypothetical protein
MTLELQLTACCVIDLEEAGATLDELLPIAQVKNCAPAVAASYEQAAYTLCAHYEGPSACVAAIGTCRLAHACARSACKLRWTVN